jgi:hypothetical protein
MSDDAAPQWRGFLRALAEEVDGLGGPGARDVLLRGVGRRMASQHRLSGAVDIAGLELEVNDALAGWGWGSVRFHFDDRARILNIVHSGLPRVGAAGDPPGTWLSAVLEGLYEGWMSELPGADASLVARRSRMTPSSVSLRYGRL